MKFIPAIQMMMRDIKEDPTIPSSAYKAIRYYLHLMYVVGWEERNEELTKSTPTILIGQYNRDGKLINTFKTVEQAVRETKFPRTHIEHYLHTGKISPQGWNWKYLFINSKDEEFVINNDY